MRPALRSVEPLNRRGDRAVDEQAATSSTALQLRVIDEDPDQPRRDALRRIPTVDGFDRGEEGRLHEILGVPVPVPQVRGEQEELRSYGVVDGGDGAGVAGLLETPKEEIDLGHFHHLHEGRCRGFINPRSFHRFSETARIGGMRHLLAVALVAVLAVVAISLALTGDRDPADASDPVAAAPSEDVGPADPPSLAEHPKGRLKALTRGPERRSESQVEERPRSDGLVRLEGRVRVRDSTGGDRLAEDGHVDLEINGGDRPLRTAVRDGVFGVDVPVDATVKPSGARLGDRLTLLIDAAETQVTGPITIEVRAFWPSGTKLHVVDAVTRAELDDVTLIRCEDRWSHGFARPPVSGEAAKKLVESESSPIELPRRINSRSVLWATAPGYAWGRIAIDDFSSGDRTLRLERASELVVFLHVLATSDFEDDLFVRLRRGAGPEGKEVVAVKLERDRLADGRDPEPASIGIDRLAPGPYRVSAELGARAHDSHELTFAPVDLAAGTTQEVRLLLSPPARGDRVPLSGTLILPPAWDALAPGTATKLRIELAGRTEVRTKRVIELQIGSLPLTNQATGERTFDAGRVIAGDYGWSVPGTGWEGLVEVGAASTTDARLIVPEPARLVVEVVEEVTERPVETERLYWRPVITMGPNDAIGDNVSVRGSRAQSRFEVVVPCGLVMVHVFGFEGYGFGRAMAQIGPAGESVTLELARNCELIVRLVDGETVVPLDGVEVEIERAGGGGRPQVSSSDGRTKRFWLGEPGRYVVDVERPPGFLDPPPIEVHVEGDETTAVILLVRE